jgi:hypothetical protein
LREERIHVKVVITINCDVEALNGADCGTELARILRQLARKLEFQSKEYLAPRAGKRHRIRLVDHDGIAVGEVKFIR